MPRSPENFGAVIDYDRYEVCEGRYPFRRLGTMNKIHGDDDAKHIEAARRRFNEPHPVLVDLKAQQQADDQAMYDIFYSKQ